eukprot:352580-Chlamydomonas_euryale.AAC.4
MSADSRHVWPPDWPEIRSDPFVVSRDGATKARIVFGLSHHAQLATIDQSYDRQMLPGGTTWARLALDSQCSYDISAFASRVDQMVSPRPYPTARSTSSRKGEGKGKGNKDRKGPQEPKEETRGKSQSRVGVRSDSLESERERTPFLHQVWAWLFETREQFRSSAPAAQQQRTRHARCTCARHRAARWPHRGAPSPPLQRAPCWLRSVDHRWGARVCSNRTRTKRKDRLKGDS